jgi:hypothetical protein
VLLFGEVNFWLYGTIVNYFHSSIKTKKIKSIIPLAAAAVDAYQIKQLTAALSKSYPTISQIANTAAILMSGNPASYNQPSVM